MKRFACLFVFICLLSGAGSLFAQEITGFKASRVNKRYEIRYDLNRFDWNERCDVFFYARAEGSSDWFKLHALVGSYLNVETRDEYTVLWEPLLDYKQVQKYDFRLFAVNRKYLGRDYDYDKVRQVGLVYPRSNEQGAGFTISGVKITSSVPIALPVGEYEAGITKDNVLRGRAPITVKAFSYSEPELAFMDGTLTLQTRDVGTTYKIKDRIYTDVTKMKLPIGDYQIEVIPPDDVKSLGISSIKETLTIGNNEEVNRIFTFNYGKLTLMCSEPEVTYYLNDKRYETVRDMKLKPGTYVAKAVVKAPGTQKDYEKSNSFIITAGKDIVYTFNFDFGYLTLRSTMLPVTYEVDGTALQEQPDRLKLMVGTHNYTVTYKLPYRPAQGSFILKAGDEYSETVSFVKDKNLVRQKRRQQYQASLPTLPFTNFSYDHYFLIEEDPGAKTGDKVAYSGHRSHSFANGITISGFQFRGAMNRTYDKLHEVRYAYPYLSVGVMDNLKLAYTLHDEKFAVSCDWFTAGLGIALLNRQGTVFTDLEAKFVWTGQSALNNKMTVGGTDYTFVRRFADVVPGDDDPEGEPYRAYHQADICQVAGEVVLRSGVHLGNLGFLYGYVGARIQEKFGGGWYRTNDLQAWLHYAGDKPTEQFDDAFPVRKALFGTSTYRVGIGLGIPLSRRTYMTIFG